MGNNASKSVEKKPESVESTEMKTTTTDSINPTVDKSTKPTNSFWDLFTGKKDTTTNGTEKAKETTTEKKEGVSAVVAPVGEPGVAPGVPGGKPMEKVVVVKMYMNGCPACEAYKSTWNKMVNEYKSNPSVKFYSFEQDKIQAGILKKFNAKFKSSVPEPDSFPTLVIFATSHPTKVHELASRDPEEVKSWIKKMSSSHGGAKKSLKKEKGGKRKTEKRK